MVLEYSHFIYLIANLFRVFSINLFLETCFSKKNLRCLPKLKNAVFILYFILNSAIYLEYQTPVITVFSNFILFFLLTLPYTSTIYKRIFVICCVFLLGVLCETVVGRTMVWLFGYTTSVKVLVYTVSNFLFYAIIVIVKEFFVQQEERTYQKWIWFILIMIPAISSFADVILLRGDYEQWITVVVVACLFIINIAFFYLYRIIVSSCEIEMQNQFLVLQNKAYQQQLDMIHATEDRLQRAKHDFKNHLIALERLTNPDKTEELKAYFQKMDQEYFLAENCVATGNEILDGLINSKLKTIQMIGASVEMNMQIPEKINVNAFDLVVVIGNLLDNAIEALSKDGKGKFCMEIRYKKGMLFINSKNTYTGEIIKKGKSFLSTKCKSEEVHGIGLSNVKRVIDQYHGDIMIHTENNIFAIQIVMYI